MVFSSYTFFFLFLPIALLLYFAVPIKNKMSLLLIFSVVYYAWSGIYNLIIIVLSIIINYLFSLWLFKSKNNKKVLIISAVVDILFLLFFKLTGVLFNHEHIKNISLPLGISFFTFSELSLLFDIFYEKVSNDYNLYDYALYILFFPKITSGPIVRFDPFLKQCKHNKATIGLVATGFRRFICGLAKKVILADTFGQIVDNIFSDLLSLNFGNSWFGAITYMLQLYFDFSGYSDMAIGLANIFGFKFEENFNYPYIATSITDFWRRWHISLSQWFKDYVYIPLGGNRVGTVRHIFNILIVWLLTGIWHGMNYTFIIWGIYFAILLLIEKYVVFKYIGRSNNLLRWFITMLFVLIGWIIFRINTIDELLLVLRTMFSFEVSEPSINSFMRLLTNYWLFLIIGIVGALPIKRIITNAIKTSSIINKLYAIIVNIYIGLLFILSVVYILSGNYKGFIYFQF